MSMPKIFQFEKDSVLYQPPPVSPYPSFTYSVAKGSSSSSSSSKISPVVLLVIVILAIIFFLSGLLHLLIRYLMKRPSLYSLPLSFSQSNRYHADNNNNSNSGTASDALQRQLQQLFRLHDSGLDQAVIDSLPVFYYNDIMGLKKEGFDCAVCLCEFSAQDKLRLLPLCCHAFHISCIDTWLLSNSTCPLCRGSLVGCSGGTGYPFDGGSIEYYLAALSDGCSSSNDRDHNGQSFRGQKPSLMEEPANERRVFSVRLGKFRSLNNNGGLEEGEGEREGEDRCISRKREEDGETSSSSGSSNVVDARRCYSLGTYQYVLGESDLLVALAEDSISGGGDNGAAGIKGAKVVRGDSGNNNTVVDDGADIEGKKITRRHRGDSFSVSKIWLWSKKGRKFPISEVSDTGGPSNLHVGLSLTKRVPDTPL